jgi:hypothetical protein
MGVSLLEGEPEEVEVEVQVEVEVEVEVEHVLVVVVASDSLEHEDSLSRRLRDTRHEGSGGKGQARAERVDPANLYLQLAVGALAYPEAHRLSRLPM